nr:hypothetical protein [Streptomyces sabulosicollis]
MAGTTWAGSTPSSGIEVRSGRSARMLRPPKIETQEPVQFGADQVDFAQGDEFERADRLE